MAFSEVLLDHFNFPRNIGEIEDAEAEAEAENPVCGDRLHLWLRVREETIEMIRWRAQGCAPAIAAASMLSEMVEGMTLAEARELNRSELDGALGGLPGRKSHAAHLAVAALREALEGL